MIMKGGNMNTLYVTDKINKLLNQRAKSLKVRSKEGLAHSILLLALSDNQVMANASLLNKYLGDIGVIKLERKGL